MKKKANKRPRKPAPPPPRKSPPDVKASQVSMEWFHLWSEAGFDGISLHEDGVIQDANRAAAAMYGCELSGFVGRSVLDFTAPECREMVRGHIESGFDKPYETVGLKKNGRKFPLEIHAKTIVRGGRRLRLAILRDITERKRADEALRASEERYRLLAEAAHDMIFMIGRDGLVQYVNTFAAAALGLRPQDIIGQPRERFFPTTQSDRQTQSLRKVFESGQPLYIEATLPFPKGEVWLGTWLVPVRNEDGPVVAVQGISRDITERKRAEEALRLQSAALESAANGTVITDRQGKIVWTNPAFTRLTGYTAEEILGQNIRLLKSGRHDTAFYQRMWETILAGLVWRGEVFNRRKDGAFYVQEQTVTPVRDACGEIAHFIAIQQDITERKRMETELRESRERFERIFQSNPEAITIHAGEDNRFIDVNDAFLGPLGFTREEVIGRTPAELGLFADPKDRERVRDRLQAEGRLRNFECRFRGKDGRVFEALLSTEPIQLGSRRCLLSIVNDITRWKQQQATLEDRLRQAQKLESIGTLAGGVAHDFNNILTIIQGHAGLLLGDAHLPAACQESLEQISHAADRAANLTRQLLTFSRKQPLQRRPVDLNEVVGTMTKMLRRIIGEDIGLDIQCASRLPHVLADVGMMEQVLMNLAVNARDAIHARRPNPEAGRLVISTAAVLALAPGAQDDPDRALRDYVCLSLHDNGCGIPPEIRSRVYDPFFTTKDVGKGTGLGLATVHGIVEEHGGWIDFDSHVNQGTTFRVHLPALPREKAAVAPPRETPRVPGGRETILLVEDEEALRELSQEVLERYGYRVLAARSGKEALGVWEQHGPEINLLLTDLVMPDGVNGRQLAEHLHAERPDLRVVLTTGYSDEIEGWDHRQAEGIHHLPKPYPPHELAQVVRDCLDGVTAKYLF